MQAAEWLAVGVRHPQCQTVLARAELPIQLADFSWPRAAAGP